MTERELFAACCRYMARVQHITPALAAARLRAHPEEAAKLLDELKQLPPEQLAAVAAERIETEGVVIEDPDPKPPQ